MKLHDIDHVSEATPRHPWLALLLITLIPLILGTLLAPHLLRLLLWLGTHVELGRHFSNPPLRRVVSRTVVVLAAILILPALKLAGLRRLADLGWPSSPSRWNRMATWFAIGVLSMGAAYLLSTVLGAFYFRPRSTNLGTMTSKWILLLISAWVIGCLEETLFRGFIYVTLRRHFSLIAAAVSASLFFSAVHFLRPVEPADLNPTAWNAGFRLMAHLTDGVQRQYAAPMFVNLFLMGLVLSYIFERDRTVYAISGLHAGWIWMQGVGTFLFDRHIGRLQFLYGNSETISMTWLGTLILILFLIAAGRPHVAKSREAADGTS